MLNAATATRSSGERERIDARMMVMGRLRYFRIAGSLSTVICPLSPKGQPSVSRRTTTHASRRFESRTLEAAGHRRSDTSPTAASADPAVGGSVSAFVVTDRLHVR